MTLTIAHRAAAPGYGPAGLAWDGETLWHSDYKEGVIFGLNPETLAVRRTLFSPGNLGGLAWDGSSFWQAVFDDGLVRRINPATNDFDQTLILDEYGWLSGLAWDGAQLWVLAQQRGLLLAIDVEAGQVARALPVPVACGDLDYHDGSLWLSYAGPMRYDAALGQFEWERDEPAFAVLRVDPADGRQLAEHSAERLYSGLAWAGDNLWLAQAGDRQLCRATIQ